MNGLPYTSNCIGYDREGYCALASHASRRPFDFQKVWADSSLELFWIADAEGKPGLFATASGLRRWLEPPRAEVRDSNTPFIGGQIESVRLRTSRRASIFGTSPSQKGPNDSNVSIWGGLASASLSETGPLGVLPGAALFFLREDGFILGKM
jgi:hypothetical protein